MLFLNEFAYSITNFGSTVILFCFGALKLTKYLTVSGKASTFTYVCQTSAILQMYINLVHCGSFKKKMLGILLILIAAGYSDNKFKGALSEMLNVRY